MEKWKVISFNDRYEVSNYGRIRNRITKKVLKPRKPRRCHGQLTIFLAWGSNGWTYDSHHQFTISQIVYNHWGLKEGEKETYYWMNDWKVKNNRIGHRDGNVENNNIDNLYRY